jgi:hypothetical protein
MIVPGFLSSKRIRTLKAVPTIADQEPNTRYIVPISLWLVENIHLLDKMAEIGIKL